MLLWKVIHVVGNEHSMGEGKFSGHLFSIESNANGHVQNRELQLSLKKQM